MPNPFFSKVFFKTLIFLLKVIVPSLPQSKKLPCIVNPLFTSSFIPPIEKGLPSISFILFSSIKTLSTTI